MLMLISGSGMVSIGSRAKASDPQGKSRNSHVGSSHEANVSTGDSPCVSGDMARVLLMLRLLESAKSTHCMYCTYYYCEGSTVID